MEDKKDRISLFQIVAIFTLVALVPIIRAFSLKIVETSGKAAVISALLVIVPAIVLVLILNSLINNLYKNGKKVKVNTFLDVLDNVYGKAIGKIIAIAYLIFVILVAACQLRLFAERLISTMFIYAPIKFFLITMLVVVFFAVRGRAQNLGRFCEIILELFVFVFIFVNLAAFTNLKIENIWPMTNVSVSKIIIGALDAFNLFSLFTMVLFLGDGIENKDNFKKYGIITAIIVTVIGAFAILITLGTFGKDILLVLPQPFFMTLKVISLFDVIERIESIFITFWVAADFIIICFNIFIASNICYKKFRLSSRKLATTPIVFVVYILSILLANSYFTLEIFTREFVYESCSIFCFAIPFITYIIAKLRKMIKNKL